MPSIVQVSGSSKCSQMSSGVKDVLPHFSEKYFVEKRD